MGSFTSNSHSLMILRSRTRSFGGDKKQQQHLYTKEEMTRMIEFNIFRNLIRLLSRLASFTTFRGQKDLFIGNETHININ